MTNNNSFNSLVNPLIVVVLYCFCAIMVIVPQNIIAPYNKNNIFGYIFFIYSAGVGILTIVGNVYGKNTDDHDSNILVKIGIVIAYCFCFAVAFLLNNIAFFQVNKRFF